MKSKCAVVTLVIGDDAEALYELTAPYMRLYAARIKAPHGVIRDNIYHNKFGDHVMFNKCLLTRILKDYDRVLYVDADILISPECPNVFDCVPDAAIGAVLESKYIDHSATIATAQSRLGDIGWAETYFNAGMLVVSRCHRPMFNLPIQPFVKYGDQTQLNYNVQQLGYPVLGLSGHFNYQFRNPRLRDGYKRIDGLIPAKRFQAHMLHYSDNPKGARRLTELRRDISRFTGRLAGEQSVL